jgi:hypothetical protein
MVLHGEIQTRVFFQKYDLSFDRFELTLELCRPTQLRENGLSFLALHQALHGPAQPNTLYEEADGVRMVMIVPPCDMFILYLRRMISERGCSSVRNPTQGKILLTHVKVSQVC